MRRHDDDQAVARGGGLGGSGSEGRGRLPSRSLLSGRGPSSASMAPRRGSSTRAIGNPPPAPSLPLTCPTIAVWSPFRIVCALRRRFSRKPRGCWNGLRMPNPHGRVPNPRASTGIPSHSASASAQWAHGVRPLFHCEAHSFADQGEAGVGERVEGVPVHWCRSRMPMFYSRWLATSTRSV